MTTKERKTIQNFVNRMTELREAADNAFAELQQLNKDTSGRVWCCALDNYHDIVATSKDENRGYTSALAEKAQKLYEQYVGAEAQKDLLRGFMTDLADIGFWK